MVMMRIIVVSIFAALLAACSGSYRAEDVLPGWANTRPRPATPQHEAYKKPLEGRDKPQTEPREPQGAKQAGAQSLPEE